MLDPDELERVDRQHRECGSELDEHEIHRLLTDIRGTIELARTDSDEPSAEELTQAVRDMAAVRGWVNAQTQNPLEQQLAEQTYCDRCGERSDSLEPHSVIGENELETALCPACWEKENL